MLGSTHFQLLRKHWSWGLLLSTMLSPLATWLKWEVGGVPTTKIPCFSDRLALLQAAGSIAEPEGMWLEFGVLEGESINKIAELSEGTVYGFDSFEGLPKSWTPLSKRGSFSTYGRIPDTAPNVRLVTGWFQDTLPAFLVSNPDRMVSLIHVDSDLYESALFALKELRSRIRPGTIIVFDEFAGTMPDDEARAFREFVKQTGANYRYIGYSVHGSVAVEIT
jgi:hypothetical protein